MENLQNLHATGAEPNGAGANSVDEKLLRSAKSVAQEIGDMVGGASSAATTRAKDMLQQQLADGGELVAHIARSTRVAGDQLDREVPQLGSLVKRAASSIEDVARGMRERSIEEVVQTASDFGRRQPAVLFGITAVLGYLAFRLVNEGVKESGGTSSSS
jgi:ElaB/YqjD/DUF883 family membrane-anchored ribosome-binding protein